MVARATQCLPAPWNSPEGRGACVVKTLVEMSDIRKAFAGTAALKGVSIALQPGSVHALMGENGAGKSTLMKILAGVHQPDGGAILRDGRQVAFHRPKDALEAGISTVFQELSLLPNLTIAENMFLGREPTTAFGWVDHRRMRREAGKNDVVGRGYRVGDLAVLFPAAAASGYAAILVVALYMQSPDVAVLYHHPSRLWLLYPLLLYWITRVILLASRDELHDDPVVFALTDRVSWLVGALSVGVIAIAI